MSKEEPMCKEEIQVVRTESTLSLSERSTITYDIGNQGDSQYIRLSGNSGSGLYCKDWVAMADIKQLLSGNPTVTSKTLQPLFLGRSTNSPGFLLAAIVNEKILNIPTKSAPEVPPSKPAKVKKTTKAAVIPGVSSTSLNDSSYLFVGSYK